MHQTNHVALCGQIVNIFVGNKGSVIVTLRVNGQHPKIIFFNELAKEVLEMYSVGMLLSVTGFCVSSYHYGKYTQAIFAKTLHPMPADTYERKNEFSYEGEVVYIRNYDRHTHLVIKVVDDGHTAHIPVIILQMSHEVFPAVIKSPPLEWSALYPKDPPKTEDITRIS